MARTMIRELLDSETFAEECGISLADRPQPLFRLLVACSLAGAPVRAEAAIRAARACWSAGFGSPKSLAGATEAQRLRVLRDAGYPRFAARAARSLGSLAEAVLERYRGDLRRLRDEAEDADAIARALTTFPGVGATAAGVFCREVQAVWPTIGPFVDERALRGARALGIDVDDLRRSRDVARLAAALARRARS